MRVWWCVVARTPTRRRTPTTRSLLKSLPPGGETRRAEATLHALVLQSSIKAAAVATLAQYEACGLRR